MAVVASNLVSGPATIYTGNFGAVEPTDAQVNTTPSATAWRDLGGTSDGARIVINQEFMTLGVDQVIDVVERRRTGRDIQVATNLAEVTLENIAWVLNGGTVATASGYKTYDPDMADSSTQPNYFAIIFDGWGPMVSNQARRRRIVVRKCLNVESVEIAYTKGDQTLIPATLGVHYVSESIRPFRIIDQT